MMLKISTHADMITCIKLAPNHVISGTDSGKVYIHSLVDGQLQKQINDHFGCPITSLDFDETICHSDKLTLGGQLWLASSADRRISVWTSDWSKKIHHLAAWISFPGTTAVQAMFDRTDSDLLLYWTDEEVKYYIEIIIECIYLRKQLVCLAIFLLVEKPNGKMEYSIPI